PALGGIQLAERIRRQADFVDLPCHCDSPSASRSFLMPVWMRNPTFVTERPVTSAISRYLRPCWNLSRMTSCWFAERRERAAARSDEEPAKAGGPRAGGPRAPGSEVC